MLTRARACADSLPVERRAIPDAFCQRQRKEFLEISNRAKVELNASFSLVAIGLQLYLESAKLAQQTRDPTTETLPT